MQFSFTIVVLAMATFASAIGTDCTAVTGHSDCNAARSLFNKPREMMARYIYERHAAPEAVAEPVVVSRLSFPLIFLGRE
ncbi:hypothetical protein G7Y89_g5604 [Cudoniella acicularis]|uniref:Uncharacterized protein n=1 Tax=Cudoniella acicularis TaxID=354080 RepID=A0A8H4RM60_9HELO|nr:hypothetical protein G7Y89_g5604 [Cudoniella acicularis]